MVFYQEIISVCWIMIWWLIFEKKTIQFRREIWIQVVVILLQLHFFSCQDKDYDEIMRKENMKISLAGYDLWKYLRALIG